MRHAIATKRSRRLMLVAVGLLAAVAMLPLVVPPADARHARAARRSAPAALAVEPGDLLANRAR